MATLTSAESKGRALEHADAHRAYLDHVARNRWLILLGLIAAAIMQVLDATIINVALPQMAGNLGASNQEIGWVSTGYILASVIVLPMTAFFASRFGRKNYLTFSILLFVVASFLCGTSHSLIELVFWRIVQGAGGAALMSTAQATLRQIFPREEQGIVQSAFMLGIIVAPTVGPTVGGWITDNYTWNWCFFINVPVGLAAAFLVTSFLHDPPGMRDAKAKVDYAGVALLAVGLGCLQYVLEEGQQNDWFQDRTITTVTLISVVALAAVIYWQLTPRNRFPVVDLRVLNNRSLAMSVILLASVGFGLFGGVFLFPLFTQTVLGFSPTQTGLVLLPGGIMSGVGGIFCGYVLNGKKPLIDARIPIFVGIAIFVFSMWLLGHMTIQSGQADTQFALLLRGLGFGFIGTPIVQVAYLSVDPKRAQQASGLINLSRQLGGSFGIAILATFMTHQAQYHRANIVTHLTTGNPAISNWMQTVQELLVMRGYSPGLAQKGTIAVLDRNVTIQSLVMAYNDSFLLILLVALAVIPAVFFLKNIAPSSAEAEAGETLAE